MFSSFYIPTNLNSKDSTNDSTKDLNRRVSFHDDQPETVANNNISKIPSDLPPSVRLSLLQNTSTRLSIISNEIKIKNKWQGIKNTNSISDRNIACKIVEYVLCDSSKDEAVNHLIDIETIDYVVNTVRNEQNEWNMKDLLTCCFGKEKKNNRIRKKTKKEKEEKEEKKIIAVAEASSALSPRVRSFTLHLHSIVNGQHLRSQVVPTSPRSIGKLKI